MNNMLFIRLGLSNIINCLRGIWIFTFLSDNLAFLYKNNHQHVQHACPRSQGSTKNRFMIVGGVVGRWRHYASTRPSKESIVSPSNRRLECRTVIKLELLWQTVTRTKRGRDWAARHRNMLKSVQRRNTSSVSTKWYEVGKPGTLENINPVQIK